MRTPRDVSGRSLASSLGALGYRTSHQTGSHLRLTTPEKGEHHITIPNHDQIKIGTLNSILREVAAHHEMTAREIRELLFG